jgi:hypothetical protein
MNAMVATGLWKCGFSLRNFVDVLFRSRDNALSHMYFIDVTGITVLNLIVSVFAVPEEDARV